MKKISLTVLSLMIVMSFAFAQKKEKSKPATFKWYTFDEAIELNTKVPKKVFVDVYTDWCGWCKKMEATTFSDSIIRNYMMQNFYPVRLNAEGKDTVFFNGSYYVNPSPTSPRSTHQLAVALLQGRMSYPSIVVLNEKMEILNSMMGYKTASEMETILHFFAENAYSKTTFAKYLETFKGKVAQ